MTLLSNTNTQALCEENIGPQHFFSHCKKKMAVFLTRTVYVFLFV